MEHDKTMFRVCVVLRTQNTIVQGCYKIVHICTSNLAWSSLKVICTGMAPHDTGRSIVCSWPIRVGINVSTKSLSRLFVPAAQDGVHDSNDACFANLA